MKVIFITLSLSFIYSSAIAETRIFKLGYIDLKNDVSYSDWGRHPVDIRSKHSKEHRAIDGARLGVIDSEKYERMTKTKITLDYLSFSEEKKLLTFFKSEKPNLYNAILLDLNLKNLNNIIGSLKEKNKVIFFNVSNSSNLLRTNVCAGNLYHTYPSDMMKTDALAQFLVQKKWNKTLLLTGSLDKDISSSDSFKLSSRKRAYW